jgi:hypothetical protein
MLNTTPFTSLAGTVWIEIDAGATVNGTLDLLDMGEINYEFDLIPSDQEIKSIGGMPGATSIVLDDMISNRTSLYEALNDALGEYDGLQTLDVPKAKVGLYLQDRKSSELYHFPFEFTVADIAIDERSKKTTIGLSPRTINLTVDQWKTNAITSNSPSRISFLTGDGSVEGATYFPNSWASGDFIYNVVEQLDTNGNTIFISGDLGAAASLPNAVYVFERLTDILNSPTNIFTSDYSSLMFVTGTPMSFADSNSVFGKVQTFAGMEGAIFGAAFNYNYYINRLTNTINVNVSNNDLSDLKFQAHNRDVNGVSISFTNTNKIDDTTNIGYDLPKITNATGGAPGWLTGQRPMSTAFTGFYPYLNRGVYDAGDNFVNGDNDSLAFFNDQTLCRFAADVYSKVTGAYVSNRSLYKVDFEVLGATKIKPWEVIRFNETVPSRYWGKHFRPTSLSYDLKADRVRVTAYEIDTFEFTPPEPPPPQGDTNIKACENGTYMVSLVYATNATADPVYTNDNGNYMLFSVYATNATGDPVYSNENGNYMVEAFTGTNTMISAQSETNGTATDFTATL